MINCDCFVSGVRFKKDYWKNLNVGDFVCIYKDDDFFVDVIVLLIFEVDGGCYVEMKNFDGEMNLKV